MAATDNDQPDRDSPRKAAAWWLLGAVALLLLGLPAAMMARRHLGSPAEREMRLILRDVRREARDNAGGAISALRQTLRMASSELFGGTRDTDDKPDPQARIAALGPEAAPLLAKTLRRNRSVPVREFCAEALAPWAGDPAILAEMLAALHDEPQDPVRAAILKAIATQDAPGISAVLLDHLRTDPAPDVRTMAAKGLARHDDPAVSDALAKALTGDSAADVREAAIAILGGRGDERHQGLLLTVLAGDPAAQVRTAAAVALSASVDPAAAKALAKALREDSSEDVRQTAIEAIMSFDLAAHFADLVHALQEDSSTDVRAQAAKALGQLGSPEAFAPLAAILAVTDPATAEPLKDLFGDDADVPTAAARALGRIGHPDAVPVLCAVLDAMPPHGLGAAAAESLGHLGDARAVSALAGFLEQLDPLRENDWKRHAPPCLSALAMVGGETATQTLGASLAATATQDYRRLAIAQALALAGTPGALAILSAAEASPETDVRLAAAIGLCMGGSADGVAPLLAIVAAHPHRLSREAVVALGDVMDPRTLPTLTAALAQFAEEASWALGHLDDPRAADALLGHLRTTTSDMNRLASGFALAEIADAASSEALTELLTTRHDEYSQLAVAAALACRGRAEALPVLARFVRDDAAWMRLAAAMGLIRLGTPDALAALRPMLADTSPPLRTVAHRAMDGEGSLALTAMLASSDDSDTRNVARCLTFLRDPATRPILAQTLASARDPETRRHLALAIRRLDRDAANATAPDPRHRRGNPVTPDITNDERPRHDHGQGATPR